ncbi:MAG: FAD-binding oxidoreductase [Gammaproteobacteria bacterium]|nr:FAD-binding oxidoreductase [Gammaproteobacteria bacterium]
MRCSRTSARCSRPTARPFTRRGWFAAWLTCCGPEGVDIIESTPARKITAGTVETTRGTIDANIILRATEGYTDSIHGHKRQLLPLYSMMVATEPLPDAVWDEIGLRDRETFGDLRRIVIYGQRTLDNRFAFGGRAGYFFGSGIKPVISPHDAAVRNVEQTLRRHFPQLEGFHVTHGWGGLMGAPRNWRPYVHFDSMTGFGAAGGYTGEGVGASNLAGRILADLALERDTDLTTLPWVGKLPPRWEPEPLRWLGAKALEFLGDRADATELRTGKPSKSWGGLFSRFFQ